MGERAKTIKEFCETYRITPPTYYKLKNCGRGPSELRLRNKVVIPPEAERHWVKSQMALKGEHADEQRRIDNEKQERARDAVKRRRRKRRAA